MASTNVSDIDYVKPVMIDYEKHIEFLEEAVERMEEELKLKDEQITDANKTLDYYANRHSYVQSKIAPGLIVFDTMKSEDCEKVGDYLTGGSRAREYQNRWRKDELGI